MRLKLALFIIHTRKQSEAPANTSPPKSSTYRAHQAQELIYLRGTNLEEAVAPIPGLPCLMGL